MSEDKSWAELLREVGSKAKAEVRGERAEELKQKLRQARDGITRALNSEDAQRVKDKLDELGSRAEEAMDRAVTSEAAREIVDGLEEVIDDLGEGLEKLVGEPRPPEEPPPDDARK
jgi:uncharacterized protein YjgD (DUF1641 family)